MEFFIHIFSEKDLTFEYKYVILYLQTITEEGLNMFNKYKERTMKCVRKVINFKGGKIVFHRWECVSK